ncbi:Kinase family protein with ARM repeat domain isoform 2 [Hibiscus syriacus]|uniref:Kinase family protein with ARM repeat domain isoform 2 n=1 Tax=Hibiscus syriacus TaxID=106335 RepID=A0A6A3CMT5_HIBSY|nr:Kinase family protein with ARM repeat domain isoform 2 [Hibiscus syriacus]
MNFLDSSWARELTERRSTSGYCSFVWENLVTWRSKKQAVVCNIYYFELQSDSRPAISIAKNLVRVSALLCLGEFVNTLDKKAVLDVLQTIQRCTAVDHSAPTLMSTLAVSNSILKQYGIEFAAEHILPLLIPLLTAQQLNVQQFAKYMLFVKDILRKIEEKRGVTLTDSGMPEVKHAAASTTNGLPSQALGKANGTVAFAKSSPAWDEDWVPTTGAAANVNNTARQPSKNDSSVHSILGDKSIQSAPGQSQSSLISAVSSQQTSNSCPAVDIEWPPRPTSGVTAESGNGEKQLNAGTSLPSNFEDINPFANWPPRSSTSSNDSGTFSNGSMGPGMNNYGFSSIASTTNYQTDNSNSWMFGNQNSGSSTLNVNGGGPQNSIGFMKQNQRVSASMSSSYDNQKPAADIGSIFGSSKNKQTAPRLAPPPSTAVSRGRGRGRGGSSGSKTSYGKATSEQPPLLDLL